MQCRDLKRLLPADTHTFYKKQTKFCLLKTRTKINKQPTLHLL